jgi:hypothetical protein
MLTTHAAGHPDRGAGAGGHLPLSGEDETTTWFQGATAIVQDRVWSVRYARLAQGAIDKRDAAPERYR